MKHIIIIQLLYFNSFLHQSQKLLPTYYTLNLVVSTCTGRFNTRNSTFFIAFMFIVIPTISSHYLPQLHIPIRLKEVNCFLCAVQNKFLYIV
jgi:hypothetical protein